jgi:hypothetical protein
MQRARVSQRQNQQKALIFWSNIFMVNFFQFAVFFIDFCDFFFLKNLKISHI